nr:DNA replication complex GINS protein SLD5-like [Tanacetum cinerariifolium]
LFANLIALSSFIKPVKPLNEDPPSCAACFALMATYFDLRLMKPSLMTVEKKTLHMYARDIYTIEKTALGQLATNYRKSAQLTKSSERAGNLPGYAFLVGWGTRYQKVAEPKLDSFVICRTRKFLGALPVDDSGEENPLDMYAGDIYALRYKSIKPLIESGQLDLV